MSRHALPLTFLAAAACAPVAQEAPPVAQQTPPVAELPDPILPVPSMCAGRQNPYFLIGKHRDDPFVTGSVLVSKAKAVRWITPGMAVTKDFRADRLNVFIDDKGVITGIDCG